MIALLFGLLASPMQTADVMVTVPPGPCRIMVDGEAVSVAQFRKAAKGWAKTQPGIHFVPSPDAEYRCVDRALRLLRKARAVKSGFIGNGE